MVAVALSLNAECLLAPFLSPLPEHRCGGSRDRCNLNCLYSNSSGVRLFSCRFSFSTDETHCCSDKSAESIIGSVPACDRQTDGLRDRWTDRQLITSTDRCDVDVTVQSLPHAKVSERRNIHTITVSPRLCECLLLHNQVSPCMQVSVVGMMSSPRDKLFPTQRVCV